MIVVLGKITHSDVKETFTCGWLDSKVFIDHIVPLLTVSLFSQSWYVETTCFLGSHPILAASASAGFMVMFANPRFSYSVNPRVDRVYFNTMLAWMWLMVGPSLSDKCWNAEGHPGCGVFILNWRPPHHHWYSRSTMTRADLVPTFHSSPCPLKPRRWVTHLWGWAEAKVHYIQPHRDFW